MAKYYPAESYWTDEEIQEIKAWVGQEVYVDLGDGFDGGEFDSILEAAGIDCLTFSGGLVVPFEDIGHIELNQ